MNCLRVDAMCELSHLLTLDQRPAHSRGSHCFSEFNQLRKSKINTFFSLCTDISTEEQLRLLQEEKLCKICMDRNIAVVFIPCGHLVTCKQCAEAVDKCPMCYTAITLRQKIFMS